MKKVKLRRNHLAMHFLLEKLASFKINHSAKPFGQIQRNIHLKIAFSCKFKNKMRQLCKFLLLRML